MEFCLTPNHIHSRYWSRLLLFLVVVTFFCSTIYISNILFYADVVVTLFHCYNA